MIDYNQMINHNQKFRSFKLTLTADFQTTETLEALIQTTESDFFEVMQIFNAQH